MRITYISRVDSPPDQVGSVGETRDVSDYIGRKLVDTGYAVEVDSLEKEKTDGILKPGSVDPKAKSKH